MLVAHKITQEEIAFLTSPLVLGSIHKEYFSLALLDGGDEGPLPTGDDERTLRRSSSW